MSMIEVGDLVVVVHHCCAGGDGVHALGRIFRVVTLEDYPLGAWECHSCKQTGRDMRAVGANGFFAPLSWLKRIPPLGEIEREEILKELTA